MKKKLFLGLIPAILALSACAGITPNNNAENLDIFQEDTLIHEDIFANAETPLLDKGVRNLNPVEGTDPLIGVQNAEYKVGEDDYLALRFVAVVNVPDLANASIKWDRAIYADGGNSYKTFDEPLEVEKAYTTIYDGEGQLNISSFPGYTHFVTYTVRKIPTANSNYVVAASLIINDAASDRVVASSIDLTRQVSFNKENTGFFLSGSFDGLTVAKNYEWLNKGGNQAVFRADMNAGEGFLVVNRGENYLKVYPHTILDDSEDSTHFFTENNTQHKIVANNNGEYIFYLADNGVLYTRGLVLYLSGEEFDWDEREAHRLTFDAATDTYVVNFTSAANKRIGVRFSEVDKNGVRHEQKFSINQDRWLKCGYDKGDGGLNRITEAGTYTARIFLNDSRNPLGLEKEGVNPRMSGSNLYLRGDPAGGHDDGSYGWGEPIDNTFLFVNSSTPGYRCELRNVTINAGNNFKITTFGTWDNEVWQWNGYCIGENVILGGAPDGLTADGNREYFDYNHDDEWHTTDNWNISCRKSEKFDLFIKSNNKLEIRLAAA